MQHNNENTAVESKNRHNEITTSTTIGVTCFTSSHHFKSSGP